MQVEEQQTLEKQGKTAKPSKAKLKSAQKQASAQNCRCCSYYFRVAASSQAKQFVNLDARRNYVLSSSEFVAAATLLGHVVAGNSGDVSSTSDFVARAQHFIDLDVQIARQGPYFCQWRQRHQQTT